MKKLFLIVWMLYASPAWSYTVSGTTYTTNGSQSDVQAACSAAPDNGTVTVVVPNGTYTWTGTLTISKSLTLAGQSAKGVTITDQNTSSDMIAAISSANGHINIYWLNFVRPVSPSQGFAVDCDRTEPSSYTVMVHDCSFNNSASGSFGYGARAAANGIIFWNDTFVGDGVDSANFSGGSVTGITFVCYKYGYTSSWNTPDTFGVNDTSGLANSYVEDCTFYDASLAASNFDDNSRVVWRHNTMINASCGSHGQETSTFGVRHWEVYNNTFTYIGSGTGVSGATYPINMNCWIGVRGGSGVVTGNAMDDIPGKTGISLCVFSINRITSIPCQTAYPAARQTGQGWSASSQATYGNPVVAQDGTGAVTEGVYIWGNTGSETTDPNYVSLNQYTPDECGNGQLLTNYLQQGRDYFVGTAKPGYSPYQYPHPLHTAFAITGGSPTPTPNAMPLAPQNLRVVN